MTVPAPESPAPPDESRPEGRVAAGPAVPALPTDLVADLRRPGAVLLPGMLGDERVWDDFSLAVLDILRPAPARIDLDDSVPALAESVIAPAPARFVLIGHSLGGIVALEIARRIPERLLGLVLVNSSGRGPSEEQQRAWSEWAQRSENGGFPAIAAQLASATLAAERRGEPELVARNLAMADRVGPVGFRRQLSAQAGRPDSLIRMAELSVPTLVVSGSEDEVCPPPLQEELVAHCRAASLVTLNGGHMLPLERPAELAAAVRRWWSEAS